ncbi:MAG: sigma-54 dependent transcriptional regulator [Acidobacteriota bacterium]
MDSKVLQVVLSRGGRPVRILLEREVGEGERLQVAIKSGTEAQELPRERDLDQAVVLEDVPELGRVGTFRRSAGSKEDTTEIMVVEGAPEVESVAAVIEPEAFDFLTKPIDQGELQEILQELHGDGEASDGRSSVAKNLLRRLRRGNVNAPILGESPAMEELLSLVDRVSSSHATVLIHGETGTGKTMIAKIIHDLSSRAEGRFVAINCSAFQDQLLESELFGHEKGAFTGAVQAKEGLWEVADKGTLFLDEVAEMTASMQAKLLQVLDSGEMRRVGGTRLRKVDPRVIAATNKDIKEEVAAGRFREDLLFRLNVVTLTVPPLRERKSEIPALIEGFMQRFVSQGLEAKSVSPQAMRLLQTYGWPGNVRELSNTLEGLLLLTRGEVIQPEDLPQNIRPSLREALPEPEPDEAPVPLTEIERVHVARTLSYTEGKKAPAARLLGIDVKTLSKKIRDYGIELPS